MRGTPSAGVEAAAAAMVASAIREADQFPGGKRWIVLSLYAEIHRRVAAELAGLAQNAQGDDPA